MSHSPKSTERKTLFKGRILSLHLDKIKLPDGSVAKREVIEHGGGVAILAIYEGDVLMVRQYRHPAGQHLLELPAGKLEKGEDPDRCAIRELEEETGYRPQSVTKLGCFYPTPGYVSEILHLYLADGLVPTKQNLDPGEFLDVVTMPLEDALTACFDGRIVDAKTALALLMYKQKGLAL